jgi:hypothetical protein
MNHPFDLDNFESFLSEQADQHRMYASDRVWRKIQERLHGKDRWPALTFGAILTTTIIAVVLTFTYPKKRLYNSPADYSTLVAVHQSVAKAKPSGEVITKRVPSTVAVIPVALSPVAIQPFNEGLSVEMATTTKELVDLTQSAASENGELINIAALQNGTNKVEEPSVEQKLGTTGQSSEIGIADNDADFISQNKLMVARVNDNGTSFHTIDYSGNSIKADETTKQKVVSLNENISRNNFVGSTMAYGPHKPGKSITSKNRWLIQFYATPSISYRYMLEDKKFMDDPSAANGPLAPYLTNPASDFVRHKPKLGLEVGSAFIYQLTDNFRLKTGLQANYRQFGIQAYATNAQPARLTLNRENGIDSIVRFSSISSQAGYRPMNLSSNFLQIAIPVGFDMKVADTRSVDFYVSAAGQFTYQVASSYYVLSDDYKNYLKQPDIDRKFNINTAIEAFASFEAGGITWQAGPQIRYQLLPGSKDVYPIREHLIDYGFKVGVVKKLK